MVLRKPFSLVPQPRPDPASGSTLRWSLLAVAILTTAVFSGCFDSTSNPMGLDEEATVPAPDPNPALLPTVVPFCVYGSGASGGLVEACVPPSGLWNEQVVVWGHGYVSPEEDLAIPVDEVDGTPIRNIVTGLGFGWATSSYRKNGLAADVAVQDLDEALAFFETGFPAELELPPVRRAYLIGGSEGGIATGLSLERSAAMHPYDAGMILCAPVGRFRDQIDDFGDFRMLLDVYFPGLVPGPRWGQGGNVRIPQPLIDALKGNWEGWATATLGAAAMSQPARFAELLRVAKVATDPADPTSMVASAASVLWYNIFATNDVLDRLGGNPYTNKGRIYWGSSIPFLNWKVKRITADPIARAGLATFETDGSLTVPVVGMHTTLDPIIPFSQAARYRLETLLAGIGWRYNLLPIARYGHCEFTAPEVLAGFALMLLKATGAELTASAGLFRDQGEVNEFVMTAQELGANPTVLEADFRR